MTQDVPHDPAAAPDAAAAVGVEPFCVWRKSLPVAIGDERSERDE
jgi:hypothetical protein